MNCASTLIKLGNNSKGGKLKADFDGSCNDIPDYVRVKGTTDVNKVSHSGNWISKEKYPNTAVTLELMDCHHVVKKECTYDINGNIVVPSVANYDVDSMIFEKQPTGEIKITINFITENNIGTYNLQRMDSLNPYLTVTSFSYDVNLGGSYEVLDSTCPQEVVQYRIVGIPLDGSTPIIDEAGTAEPASPIPGVFAFDNTQA